MSYGFKEGAVTPLRRNLVSVSIKEGEVRKPRQRNGAVSVRLETVIFVIWTGDFCDSLQNAFLTKNQEPTTNHPERNT